jgi:hypothetical protein|nr:MAG TPA: hypothetical protein [Caudoviricetes sp.]
MTTRKEYLITRRDMMGRYSLVVNMAFDSIDKAEDYINDTYHTKRDLVIFEGDTPQYSDIDEWISIREDWKK